MKGRVQTDSIFLLFASLDSLFNVDFSLVMSRLGENDIVTRLMVRVIKLVEYG